MGQAIKKMGADFYAWCLPCLPIVDWGYLKKIGVKLLRWYMFSILIGILPLYLKATHLQMQGGSVDLQKLLKDGDLLLLSSAICFSAIGELLGKKEAFSIIKILCGGAALFIIVVACDNWAVLSIGKLGFDTLFIYNQSLNAFKFSLIAGTGCIAVSEDK